MFLQGISIVFLYAICSCNQKKCTIKYDIFVRFALQCNPCIPKITLFPSPHSNGCCSLSISSSQCMPPKSTLFPSPRNNPCFQKLLSFHPPCASHDGKNTYFESTSILSSYHLPKINTLQGTCQRMQNYISLMDTTRVKMNIFRIVVKKRYDILHIIINTQS